MVLRYVSGVDPTNTFTLTDVPPSVPPWADQNPFVVVVATGGALLLAFTHQTLKGGVIGRDAEDSWREVDRIMQSDLEMKMTWPWPRACCCCACCLRPHGLLTLPYRAVGRSQLASRQGRFPRPHSFLTSMGRA